MTLDEVREAIRDFPIVDGVVFGKFDKRPLAPFILEMAGVTVSDAQRRAYEADMRRSTLVTAHHLLKQALTDKKSRRADHAEMFAKLVEIAKLDVSLEAGEIRIR